MISSHVSVAGQRVAYEDCVVFCRGQCAVGLVRDGDRPELVAAFKRKAMRFIEQHGELGFHESDRSFGRLECCGEFRHWVLDCRLETGELKSEI